MSAVFHNLDLGRANHCIFIEIAFLENHGNGFIIHFIRCDHHHRFVEMGIKGLALGFDFLDAEVRHDFYHLLLEQFKALQVGLAGCILLHMG